MAITMRLRSKNEVRAQCVRRTASATHHAKCRACMPRHDRGAVFPAAASMRREARAQCTTTSGVPISQALEQCNPCVSTSCLIRQLAGSSSSRQTRQAGRPNMHQAAHTYSVVMPLLAQTPRGSKLYSRHASVAAQFRCCTRALHSHLCNTCSLIFCLLVYLGEGTSVVHHLLVHCWARAHA